MVNVEIARNKLATNCRSLCRIHVIKCKAAGSPESFTRRFCKNRRRRQQQTARQVLHATKYPLHLPDTDVIFYYFVIVETAIPIFLAFASARLPARTEIHIERKLRRRWRKPEGVIGPRPIPRRRVVLKLELPAKTCMHSIGTSPDTLTR